MSQSGRFDIVIVGGGLVGASLACALLPALRKAGLKLALIEAFVPSLENEVDNSPVFDARSTALAYGSRRIYEQLGLWQALSERATPITQIHVSDKGRFGSTRLHAAEHNVEALGYVVENRWLGHTLYAQLLADAGEDAALELLTPATVQAASPQPGGFSLSVEQDGQVRDLDARLLIIADGGRSVLCEQLHIGQQQTDYGQHAIIANLETARPHQNVAYERFTADGPLALLPLRQAGAAAQHRLAMVMTVSDAHADEVANMDDAGFLALAQERFGYRLGQFVRVGERFSYPLVLRRASEQLRPGLVVIGNAAHTLHPVAGQGFNLALRGVISLAETLQLALESDQPLGDMATLESYLQARLKDQDQTVGFTDQTLRLFSNNDLLLGIARDLGLLALDLFPTAKALFARQAMGLRGRPFTGR